jgi:hypothetical protein
MDDRSSRSWIDNSIWLAFWLLKSLWGIQWRCLISDCEMQRIDKPTIYSLCNAFWNTYLADDLPYRRKGSSDKASRIILFTSFSSFTSSRRSSLGEVGWWGLFRIQSQTSIPAESRHTWVRDSILLEHRNKLVVDGLFERPLRRRKRTTLLCSIWSIPTIWNVVLFLIICSTFSFKDLLFQFLSLSVKVQLLEWHLMLQSRKLADDSTVRCSWIAGTSYIFGTQAEIPNPSSLNFFWWYFLLFSLGESMAIEK